MTMPHLMNCRHSDSGWCLMCVKEMHDAAEDQHAACGPDVSVHRTGRAYSMTSSEFRVVYPDGSEGFIWSPPWHMMSPAEEEAAAKEYATNLYLNGKHGIDC